MVPGQRNAGRWHVSSATRLDTTQRNFTLQQTLYDYDFQLRTTETSLNGDPALSTPSADEVLQATLQHVVATYDPIEGRSIYVNGELVTQTDPVVRAVPLIDWQDTSPCSRQRSLGRRLWEGTFASPPIHRRATDAGTGRAELRRWRR